MSGRTMRAAVLLAPGDLRVERVPLPTLGAADALVRVAACGICGSDVPRLTTGTCHFPTIPGHEMAGVVEALGPEAAAAAPGVRVGMPVAVIPLVPCRRCRLARSAPSPSARRTTTSVRGRTADSRNTCAPPRRTWCRFPRECLEQGALLERAAVALHAVRNLAWAGARASGCSASGYRHEARADPSIQKILVVP